MCFHNECIKAKVEHENQILDKFSGSNFRYIKSLRRGPTIPSTVHYEGSTATLAADKANLFNSFFYSVFTPPSPGSCRPSHDEVVDSTQNVEIDSSEVYEILQHLNPNSAMGIDGIGPAVLKFCALALFEPLLHLFQLSIATQELPAEWKLHCITPIPKSKNCASVSNYRPISLLCNTAKVLERIIYNRCLEIVESRLTIHQYGFQRNHSVTQQMLLFYDKLVHSDSTDAIYLNIAKAFDCVPHDQLLRKLAGLGVTGELWLWIRAYLTNRQQCVCLGNSRSTTLPVLSGVPQGSILGPLLFLVYTRCNAEHCGAKPDVRQPAGRSDEKFPASSLGGASPQLMIYLMPSPYLFADDTKCVKQIQCPEDSIS